jgi:hypothetical protein
VLAASKPARNIREFPQDHGANEASFRKIVSAIRQSVIPSFAASQRGFATNFQKPFDRPASLPYIPATDGDAALSGC